MMIGYARVSTEDQNLDMQIADLKKLGCEEIFMEKMSGGKMDNRPELTRLLQYARKGDTIVVYSLDRMSRSLRDIMSLIDTFEQKGIYFKSATQGFDTSTAMGKLVISILGSFAEFERGLIRQRTQDGLKAAREKGRIGGAPQGPRDPAKAALVQVLAKEGRLKVSEICRQLDIPKKTYYRYLEADIHQTYSRAPINVTGTLKEYRESIRDYSLNEQYKFAIELYAKEVKHGHKHFFAQTYFCVYKEALDGMLAFNLHTHYAILKKAVEAIGEGNLLSPYTGGEANNTLTLCDKQYFECDKSLSKLINKLWKKAVK